MLAAFDFGIGPFRQFIVNCLLVVAAFVIGYIVAGLGTHAIDRALLKRSLPFSAHRLARIIGAILGALLAAWFLFGTGPGGDSFGGGGGQSPENAQPISIPVPSVAPIDDTAIRVLILGGTEVKEARFYKVDVDSSPLTLAEVKAIVQKRVASERPPKMIAIRYSKSNQLPREHPAVTLIEKLAREFKLGVAFPEGS